MLLPLFFFHLSTNFRSFFMILLCQTIRGKGGSAEFWYCPAIQLYCIVGIFWEQNLQNHAAMRNRAERSEKGYLLYPSPQWHLSPHSGQQMISLVKHTGRQKRAHTHLHYRDVIALPEKSFLRITSNLSTTSLCRRNPHICKHTHIHSRLHMLWLKS